MFTLIFLDHDFDSIRICDFGFLGTTVSFTMTLWLVSLVERGHHDKDSNVDREFGLQGVEKLTLLEAICLQLVFLFFQGSKDI